MLQKKDKKITKKSSERAKTERGFVVLIAVLLASLFLLLGSSIFTISIRELALSFGAKESQYSFYAADSGIECALYWDFQNTFATSSYSGASPSGINCMNQDITSGSDWVWKQNATETSAETVFGFNLFPDDSDRSDCVKVVVTKNNGTTRIDARGYNTCNIESQRRFERGLRVTY